MVYWNVRVPLFLLSQIFELKSSHVLFPHTKFADSDKVTENQIVPLDPQMGVYINEKKYNSSNYQDIIYSQRQKKTKTKNISAASWLNMNKIWISFRNYFHYTALLVLSHFVWAYVYFRFSFFSFIILLCFAFTFFLSWCPFCIVNHS